MIEIDAESCNVCGVCTDICPNFVFARKNNNVSSAITVSNKDLCCDCGHCVLYCPKKAIIHEKISELEISQSTALNSNSADIELIMRARRSTRCFKPDGVPRDKVASLIDVAVNAGSASNLQSECFIVVEDQDLQNRLEEMTIDSLWNKGLKYATDLSIIGKILSWRIPQKLFTNYKRYHKIIERRRKYGRLEGMVFRKAPCIIMIDGYKFESLSPLNSALAIRNMEILATSFGLGTCWAGLFVTAARLNRKKINTALQIDGDRQILGALMVGYPKYRPHRIIRRGGRDVRWL